MQNPFLKKDISKLENQVQRIATRLSPSIRKVSYEETIQKLRLTTLETRRNVRGEDLIQFYKVLTGLDCIEWKIACQLSIRKLSLREKGQEGEILVFTENRLIFVH